MERARQTIGTLFAAAVAMAPSRPLLTYYDDASGERTELSGTTLDNWVAKTANLLVDGYGLGTADRAVVLLPAHWQTAAVLLGCWSAGLVVHAPGLPSGVGGVGGIGGSAAVADSGSTVDVVFAAADRAGEAPAAPDRLALGLAPMALPLRQVPPGFVDYVTEVRTFGDRFAGPGVPPSAPALDGATQHELCGLAAARATALGLIPGDRVLVDAATHPDPLDWLIAPLAVGATIVLCAQLDPAAVPARRQSERTTRDLL